MKRMFRMCCAVLVVCILMAQLPGLAWAEEENAQTTTDFVLVMDCSGTMLESDRNRLCASACKMFVDLIPIQNARISVIAFGYESDTDPNGFTYSAEFRVTGDDRTRVHQIVPLSSVEEVSQKVDFKHKIDTASEKQGGKTPIGHGLAAAVDVLIEGKASDGNACVILLTDGMMTSSNTKECEGLVDEATRTAGKHEWPIYCIQLDYHDWNASNSKAYRLLDEICAASGAGETGHMKVTNPTDVCEAFLRIFNNFMSTGNGEIEDITLNEDGVAEKTFYIPDLVSETNIVVSGASIESVELSREGEQETWEIKGDRNADNLKATVAPGSYTCVKLICPAAGNWKIRVYGDPKAAILIFKQPLQEMALKMIATPSAESKVLHKDNTIAVQAYFTYPMESDAPPKKNDFYKDNEAYLYVRGQDGKVDRFLMSGEDKGYTYDLKVEDAPTGKFSIYVGLEHNMFRNGEKRSNSADFSSENQELTLIKKEKTTLRGYINGEFERVDLKDIFDNPDGEQIAYELFCVTDRSVNFDYSVDESGYLVIQSGLNLGKYDVELRAKDPDMAEPVVHKMALEIEDRELQCTKLPKMTLWIDQYSFQRDNMTERVLDLNDYFKDPDGVEIIYTLGEVDNSIVEVEQKGSELYLTAKDKGKTSLTIKADDYGQPVTVELKIECVSGKTAFWAKNGIWFALGLALIVFLIAFIIFVSKNTKVKGTWTITVEENGYTAVAEGVNIAILSIGRKKAFKLKELVDEVGRFVDDPNGLMLKTANYFMDKQAYQIELKGVFAGKGFVVQKIPACDTISVDYIGVKATKKVRVTSGYVTFRLRAPGEYGTMDEMNITMQAAELY